MRWSVVGRRSSVGLNLQSLTAPKQKQRPTTDASPGGYSLGLRVLPKLGRHWNPLMAIDSNDKLLNNRHPRRASPNILPAQTKPLDQLAIPIFIFSVQIGQKPAAATNQLQQATPRVMIVRMGLEMFDQLFDSL